MGLRDIIESDLDVVFDTSGFAQDATIGGIDYPVLFDAVTEIPEFFGAGVEGGGPSCLLKSDDKNAAGIVHGTTVNIDATAYRVIGIRDEGYGVHRLMLAQEYGQ